MKVYFAEICELFTGLLCAITNHAYGCAMLSWSSRSWNPIAAMYHWSADVAEAQGRALKRCGCPSPLVVHLPFAQTVGHGPTVETTITTT